MTKVMIKGLKNKIKIHFQRYFFINMGLLALAAPITTAADNQFYDIFPVLKKLRYDIS